MIEPALSTTTPVPEEDVTTTLYRAAIGPVSSGYYLPIFTRFEAADHAGISWNTAASLLTLNWLVFRKLWVAALAYVGIVVAVALLVFGIAHLMFQFSDTLMMVLGLGFGLAAFVLPGLFGNALFHTECRKAMAKALTGHSNVGDARDALLRQASTRRRAVVLATINVAVLLLAAFAYQQFSALSHVAVMPHGALEPGNVAVGRTTDTTTSQVRMLPASEFSVATAASAAASEGPVAVSVPASTASAPSTRASAPASESGPMPAMATAVAATTPASAASTALAPAAIASAPAAPTPAKAASTIVNKTKPKPQASSPQTSTPASAPAAQVSATKKPQASTASEPAQKASSAASSQAADTKSFFINVGLFGVPENAAKAHAKLLEAGLPSVMKELKSKTRQIRVRVGPYASQAQADAATEKIKALQLDASIIQL